ncbi:MAG: glutathionylspermidine synthase family protein [Planctomycetia bacterium]|nr:glutathionylspermidine synthase family protein [Planctomycetia bacterium]
MRRLTIDPRPNWQKRVEEYGLFYHTLRDEPYWDETACYQFTNYEIDTIELATQTLHEMCMELVQEVIDKRMFGLFYIPQEFEEFVIRSWEAREPSVYGRFDLAFDGVSSPRMLEYNADTPTALVEAAVAQWFWLKDVDERGDQFNSIHERLIDAWKHVLEVDGGPIHFASLTDELNTPEDYITAEYMRDTAIQAGAKTCFIPIRDIGWNHPQRSFVDNTGFPIHRCFKLYPWEWLVKEEFGPQLLMGQTKWVEPAWKMILSCKSILPLLHERHPNSPFLLPASFDPLQSGNYVKKPIHGREGANIEVVLGGKLAHRTDGEYGGPYIYQQFAKELKPHDGRYPVLGSWIVNGVACGMGIREDSSLVTGNTSRFVPHQMVG